MPALDLALPIPVHPWYYAGTVLALAGLAVAIAAIARRDIRAARGACWHCGALGGQRHRRGCLKIHNEATRQWKRENRS